MLNSVDKVNTENRVIPRKQNLKIRKNIFMHYINK